MAFTAIAKLEKITSFNIGKTSQPDGGDPAIPPTTAQLWEKDWQIYDKPRVRVDTWAQIQSYLFTSVRVGEYIESTCRAGSHLAIRILVTPRRSD